MSNGIALLFTSLIQTAYGKSFGVGNITLDELEEDKILIRSKRQSSRVTVTYDVSKARDLEDFARRVKSEQERWFNYMADYLSSPGYTPTNRVHIYFDPNYNGVAYVTTCDRITGGVNYYRRNQQDIGSMLHELVHNIQCYKGNSLPWYFTEGIADYMRYYHYERNRAPGKPSRNQSYKDGYGTTAYFLNYVNSQVRRDMVYYVNKDAREGTYKDDIWTRLTGRTPDQLWEEMQRNG